MQEKLYHRSRMWGVEVEMQVSLNVELAIHNLETLLVAKICTVEYQQNIKYYRRPVTHSHCCSTFRIFIIASPKFQRHKNLSLFPSVSQFNHVYSPATLSEISCFAFQFCWTRSFPYRILAELTVSPFVNLAPSSSQITIALTEGRDWLSHHVTFSPVQAGFS
jgi:hypothetical protein